VPQTWDKETNTFTLTSTSYFTSTYGENKLGALKKFEAVQFHWHSGSEHTVDGLRMDAEVHTVHVPEAGATVTNDYN
jgi:carbonic anhydrase